MNVCVCKILDTTKNAGPLSFCVVTHLFVSLCRQVQDGGEGGAVKQEPEWSPPRDVHLPTSIVYNDTDTFAHHSVS